MHLGTLNKAMLFSCCWLAVILTKGEPCCPIAANKGYPNKREASSSRCPRRHSNPGVDVYTCIFCYNSVQAHTLQPFFPIHSAIKQHKMHHPLALLTFFLSLLTPTLSKEGIVAGILGIYHCGRQSFSQGLPMDRDPTRRPRRRHKVYSPPF